MTPIDYLTYRNSYSEVLAAAWLFCPETVEYRDCIFLKDHFEPANVDSWFNALKGDHEAVEAMVNHEDLADVARDLGLDDLASLSLALGECWQGVLDTRYPERGVTVEVTRDPQDCPIITLWSDHTRQSVRGKENL